MAITKPTLGSWPNLIARWKLSGLTQAEFCARRNISLPTFRYHLYKPNRRPGSPRADLARQPRGWRVPGGCRRARRCCGTCGC